jgi:ufm1-conjugating enzyme 1
MYRGGKIGQDIHFAPLWAKHSPKLGIDHALAMALGPWLAAEVPNMVKEDLLIPKSWCVCNYQADKDQSKK